MARREFTLALLWVITASAVSACSRAGIAPPTTGAPPAAGSGSARRALDVDPSLVRPGRVDAPAGVYVYDVTETVDTELDPVLKTGTGGGLDGLPRQSARTLEHKVDRLGRDAQITIVTRGERAGSEMTATLLASDGELRILRTVGAANPSGEEKLPQGSVTRVPTLLIRRAPFVNGDRWFDPYFGEAGRGFMRGETLGFETITADGRTVETAVVRIEATSSGPFVNGVVETRYVTSWVEPSTGIVLKEETLLDQRAEGLRRQATTTLVLRDGPRG